MCGPPTGRSSPFSKLLIAFSTLLFFAIASPIQAQAPATGDQGDLSGLEELVGPIALYPDDLLSIILPASTFPLQIVEADRWIEQNMGNQDAQPKDSWDDSVKALINYPEVVSMMSQDLQWTASLGEAVAGDQTAVMDAVQSFRRKAEGAGNLRTDDKQTVVVEEEVVKIVQTEPDVIYVPQYEPTVVIVEQQVPVYPTYYPAPYPVYYYPYPPGYTFAAGFFWGAATAWAFDWFRGGIHHDIDIDIDRNIDRNRNVSDRGTNIDRNRSQQMASQDRGSWQSRQNPADVRQGRSSTASRGTGQVGQRAGATTSRGGAGSYGSSASGLSQGNRGSNYQSANRHSSAARSYQPSRDAFSGMSGGRSANAYSSRGAGSRSAYRGGRRR